VNAFRLPDQFTPGAVTATAATPTCCCCCCCCLASTLTTPIVLHGGLGRDLARVSEPERPERHEKARAYSILVWFASLLATVLIAINLTKSDGTFLILVAAIVLMTAAAVALIAAWAGSPRPAMPAVRLLVCAVAFAGELIGGFYLIMHGVGYQYIGLVIAVISAAVAMKVYRP
jgi:hypothetical protein